MRVFITGVAGFLGSHLADAFIARGDRVVGCDNLIGGELDNVPLGVDFYEGDCNDFYRIKRALRSVDVVYHCAATAHEGLSVFSPYENARNGYSASASVFGAACAVGVKRIVFCSSMARYGSTDNPPFTETTPPTPQDPYGIGKYAAELMLKNLCETHGIEWTVAVPHNIYGPRQCYCMAAGSMVKMTRGFKPIESVAEGDVIEVGGKPAKVVDRVVLGRKAALQVHLETGQSVTVGRDHRFLTLEKDRLVWAHASDLKIGTAIVSENTKVLRIDRTSRDFALGQFLGLLISDGSYNGEYEITVACCIEQDKPDLRALLARLEFKWSEAGRGSFKIYGKSFVQWLRSLGLKAIAHTKSIPHELHALSHDTIAGVISGVFSGDGWVTTNQNTVGLASVSETLIRQVQKTLLAYGIKSRIALREYPEDEHREIEGRTINSGPIWYLTILSENVESFGAIGFLYVRKQLLLASKMDIKPSGTFQLGDYISQLGPLLPISVRKQKPNALNVPNPSGSITRFSLEQMVSMLDEWFSTDEATLSEEYTNFVRTLHARWTTILAHGHHLTVARVEETETDLFDISIEDAHHSYIGDGLVCHNCDPFRNVISIFTNLMLQGRRPYLYGDGLQERCFSYFTDAVEPLVRMAESPEAVGQIINIGPDGEVVTVLEVARMIAQIIGVPFDPIFTAGRPREVKIAHCSADKARRLLGFEPKVSLATGLEASIDWIKSRGPRPFSYHSLAIEIESPQLPETWNKRIF